MLENLSSTHSYPTPAVNESPTNKMTGLLVFGSLSRKPRKLIGFQYFANHNLEDNVKSILCDGGRNMNIDSSNIKRKK